MDNRHIPSLAPPRPAWIDQAEGLTSLDGALGTTLWCYVNNALLWADTVPEDRPALFSPLSAVGRLRLEAACLDAPELREALISLASLLRAPDLPQPSRVAAACAQVSRWAEDRSLTLTACHFAEAAAYADSVDPEHPMRAARLCRRAAVDGGAVQREGQLERSAQWYRRAYGIARHARRPREMIGCLLGHGSLLYTQGRIRDARACVERAARRAESVKNRSLLADAQVDLLLLELEERSTERAGFQYASRAIHLRSPRSDRLAHLVHDIAAWLLSRAHYSLAGALLNRLPRHMPKAEEQALVLGAHAHALAGARQAVPFAALEERALTLATTHEEYGAAALANLAFAAWARRKWSRAEEYARFSAEIAERRGNIVVLRRICSLLERIHQKELAPGEAPAPSGVVALARYAASRIDRVATNEA